MLSSLVSRTIAVGALAATLALSACSGADPAPSPSPSATSTAATNVASASAAPTPTVPDPSEEPTPMPTATESPAPASAFFDAGSQADTSHRQLLDQGRDADAALIKLIADQPQARWIGEWLGGGVTGEVARVTGAAADAGQIALFVLYAIPGRDCGLYSAGGVAEDQYLGFVQQVADGIDPASETWIVLEPDALAQLGDCDGQGDRVALLAGAARILDGAGAKVFLDAGHSQWLSFDEAARRIGLVGTDHLAGFATNTSNYNATDIERAWADQVAAATGLRYVTDTSRNGNGSNGEWCNPRGRALGDAPQVFDEGSLAALAWVKAPGESDGTCNGGPAAGQWWLEIALEMAGNA